MNKLIIAFCIFSNFWGVYFLQVTGIVPKDSFIVSPNHYYSSTILELAWISVALLIIFHYFMNVDRKKIKYVSNLKNVDLLYIIYFLFIILFFNNINFSLDNSLRGVDQFELAGRSGLSGLLGSIGSLVLPFILFVLIHKPFKEYNSFMVLLLVVVILIANITHGGRRWISYLGICYLLYFFYIRNIQAKKFILPVILLFTFFSLSMALRRGDDLGQITSQHSLLSSVFQVNSDPSFLWAVKSYEDIGITMSPFDFAFHFISIFVPSFVYILLTGQISYDRSVFLFDKLFNYNADQGYDFMTLADFYWCFGYSGYLLYIVFIGVVLYIFKKFIYSRKTYQVISAIIIVIYTCQQRNDFGAIIKPIVYCSLFAWLLTKLFVKKEQQIEI